MMIQQVQALEVLDSRGFPTLATKVTLKDGSQGFAMVPSGASTGTREACELRDGDKNRYLGRGVIQAVENVNTHLAKAICGQQIADQRTLDAILCNTDGSENKSHLGANALLSVSMAAAHAAASCQQIPLYRYIQNITNTKNLSMPIPMMNVINGGAHASNSIDFQEFMIAPISTGCFAEGLQVGAEVFHTLKAILQKQKHITTVGDEGGFAPNLNSNVEVLDILVQAVEQAGYIVGKDIAFALDCAASELYQEGVYHFSDEQFTSAQMIDHLTHLTEQYPIYSIEDGLDEDDWQGWCELTKRIGDTVQLVGDDLFVTNTKILQRGIDEKTANSILIKPNQIGTLTETLDAIALAQQNNYTVVISHRSGETEDTTIADIAVGTGAGQIKTGSLSRSDRVAKYNRLLVIEQEADSIVLARI